MTCYRSYGSRPSDPVRATRGERLEATAPALLWLASRPWAWRSPLERLEPFQAQATTALGLGLAPSKRGFISANSSAAAARWQRSSAQRQCVAFKS